MWYNTGMNQTEEHWKATARRRQEVRSSTTPTADLAKTGEERSDAEYVAAYKLKYGEGIFRDPFDGIVIPLFIIWNMLAPLVLIASIAMFFGPGWFLGLFYILVWCALEPDFSEEWRGARHHRSLDEYRISVMKFREDKAIKEQKRRAEAPRFTPPINMEQKRPYCGHAGYEY